MSKILIIPNTKQLKYNVDGYILGIENLSVNMPIYFNINEVKEIIKNNPKKEIFISLNKNMFNEDLDYLKEILLELNNLDIKGVLFYDLAILNLKEKLNLKYDLVWNQEHLVTNYETINYYYNFNVKYACLSNEITLREILEIKENTDSKLMIMLFGYIPMFTSKRHLVNNYLETFNINDNSKINYIEKEDKTYPIIDDNIGTTVYNSHILNGIEEYLKIKEHNIDYIILNSFEINDDDFIKIIDLFKNVNSDNIEQYKSEIEEMCKTTDTAFLHKETVYKVV